jgi:hypothetical protein
VAPVGVVPGESPAAQAAGMSTSNDPDRAADGGSARYGKPNGARGSGHQESRKPERKEEGGFRSRQGGSQNRKDPRAAANRGHESGGERG